ncbi:ATP-dependent RNA helicase DDX51-like [Panonychus citri]|uniref:ATP-dependent RNA helicase DDX51-like n=1 Tax=Panonychus citri TaxID=50023 RepID=UPI0023075770|nr:ATP-dependent RNA helicase DDX51-like [Panonychus citri]
MSIKLDSENCVDEGEKNGKADEKLFPVIGKVKKSVRHRLQAPVPKWFQSFIPFAKDFNCNDSNCQIDCLTDLLDGKVLEICRSRLQFFFPVQKTSIPVILDSLRGNNYHRGRDVCVSSPTGSGKTLAFIIPIIQSLANRVEIKLRSIIILPVRDLACQVFKVLEDFASPLGLKASLSVGQRSFTEDMNSIVKEVTPGVYKWLIDILVTTPSRLIDLIHSCPGFNLSSLQILVLDEVDRILDFDIEYNWLEEIDKAVYGKQNRVPCPCCKPVGDGSTLISSNSNRGCLSLVSGCNLTNYSSLWQPYIKLIFSATLAKDVDNLFLLNLFKPILLMATESTVKPTIDGQGQSRVTLNEQDVLMMTKNILPQQLVEKFVIVQAMNKPLVLWHMMNDLKYRRVLCFTSTIKRAQLLAGLMKNIPNLNVYQFSSKMSDSDRNKVLAKFQNGAYDIIIATDIMTRGIDIDGIDYVISYDVPFNDIYYVHRVGRTARAGRPGTAITILATDQVGKFHVMMRKIHPKDLIKEKVIKMNIESKKLTALKKPYRKALKILRQKVNLDQAKTAKRKKKVTWKGLNANRGSTKSTPSKASTSQQSS